MCTQHGTLENQYTYRETLSLPAAGAVLVCYEVAVMATHVSKHLG